MNIIFYTDRAYFTGRDLEIKGIGGSEAAVIHVSRELVKLGHSVQVFCETQQDHLADGVVYHPISTYPMYKSNCDIFVSGRSAYVLAKEEIKADKIIFWSEDDVMEGAIEHLCSNSSLANKVDCLVAVSDYARSSLIKEILIPKDKIFVIRNGYYPKFICEANKIPNRFVYTSTPYRGLDVLLEVWDSIYKRVPNAELYIFTGMSLYGQPNDSSNFLYNRARRKKGIVLHEPICQRKLYDFMSTCSIMLYPNHYVEASCMCVIEALANKIPIITSDLGALPELVKPGKNGELVKGHARHPDYQKEFIEKTLKVINDLDSYNSFDSIIKDYTWENRAKEWENLFKNLLSKNGVNYG